MRRATLGSGPVATTIPPTVGVLAVQGDVREHARALERCGARVVPVRRPRELDSVQGLVIPGGESTVIDKLLRAFDLRDPVRARIADGMPAFGSCAGMILLADRVVGAADGQQTLGGIDMTVRRNAFGRQVDSFEVDLPIAGVTEPPWSPRVSSGMVPSGMVSSGTVSGDRVPNGTDDSGTDASRTAPGERALGEEEGRAFRGVFIRAPRVEQTGPAVEILARLPATGDVVAVRQGALLATAFHPEVGGDRRLHAHFVALITDR